MSIAGSVISRTCGRAGSSTCVGSLVKKPSNTGMTSRPATPGGSAWMRQIGESQTAGGMDKIFISGIDCVTAIGVTPEERTMKQRLSLDVEIWTDVSRAAQHDSLKDTLDYSKVAHVAMDVCRSRDFHLIETVAELVAARILAEFPTGQVR